MSSKVALVRDPGTARREVPLWLAIAVLAVIGGAVPLIVAGHFGALGIPRNDDWAYTLSAFRLADGRGIDGLGWPSMNLVGQLVLSLPTVWLFGHKITALQVETIAFGVVGLVATFDLARIFVPSRRALFIAISVAIGPMWASLAVSYMTDVPAYTLGMVSLMLGVRALRSDFRPGLFWSALAVGLVGFTVRESAAVAPLAVLFATLSSSSGSSRASRRAGWQGLVVLGVGAALFTVWHRGLAGFQHLDPTFPTALSAKLAGIAASRTALLVGVLLIPAVLLAGPVRLLRDAWRRASLVSLVLGVLTALVLFSEVLRDRNLKTLLGPGTYVLSNGSLGTLTIGHGARPELLPRGILLGIAVLGAMSFTVLVIAIARPLIEYSSRIKEGASLRPRSAPLTVLVVAAIGFGLLAVVPPLFGIRTYDRYVLPLVPLLAVLVVHAGLRIPGERRAAVATGITALALLAALGLVFAMNTASFDGARWKVATAAARSVGASRVEGGFEWVDYHAGREVFFAEHVGKGRGACFVLSSTPDPSGTPARLRAHVWSATGDSSWIVARKKRGC